MKISKILINNFRQFKNVDINFDNNINLNISIGQNGAGKSNIMNIINWCLYGDEPHLSIKSKTLPLVNLNTLQDAAHGQNVTVHVELWIDTVDFGSVVFSRTHDFKVIGEGIKQFGESEFEVRIVKSNGNTDIIDGEKAQDYVNRFVPEHIREFFFFDGERLDKYFIDATGEKISQNTFEISQIDLLKLLEDKLNTISTELTREAGRTNPDLDEINKKVEKQETKLSEKKEEIKECKNQIRLSKEIITENNEFLDGIPDIEEEEKRWKELDKLSKQKKEKRENKTNKRKDLLMEYGKILNVCSVLNSTLHLIEDKRNNNELPPNINADLLKDVLDQGHCAVCNRSLDNESRKDIKNMLDQINLSSNVAQGLLKIESPIKILLNRVENFKSNLDEVTLDIDELANELSTIEEEMNEIDRKINGYQDIENIKKKHNERKRHKKLLNKNLQRLGVLQEQEKNIQKKLDHAIKERNNALKKDEKVKELNKQFEFTNKAINVIKKSKEQIMGEVKEQIEEETRSLFFDLIWKKNTFKDVLIDDNYNLNLYHKLGYECLGSISAAERELLALSFTLALHKVSGFNSPLIIDTPVARVSDTNRVNFAKVLAHVSESKQVILLFTPDEFSDNIKSIFADDKCNKYKFKLSNDERETCLEVI